MSPPSQLTEAPRRFGDCTQSIFFLGGCGKVLAVQVVFCYILLGALVTRFAVLFTAGGPAGKFADEEKDMEAKKGR